MLYSTPMSNTATAPVKAWISNRAGIVSQIFATAEGFEVFWAGAHIATAADLAAAIRVVMTKTPAWDLTQLSV